uniref:non-specific serine/threonine protein kinase n=1 Tax=Syphacia muris TaxID=451379 RepID=A0A0N5A9W4_9BILA
MPLFFGSSTVKPQHFSNRNGSGNIDLKDSRGTVVKLQNYTVVIEKKLAEGGFAIIYLVNDKSNHQFALKRQFINDDRQLEACKRECCIIKCLQGHQNIIRYVDHLISRNKFGIYEYSLLTVYYKSSVLQLMNERLMSRRSLSPVEILSIFCDICEAVARLHHSQTPVIHRDLKIENILIDDRGRSSSPRYVLCDFGSATTKVFSLETHSRQVIEDEILRYTTLSYRAPEMIDIYAGRPIGTKCDIWAMGVLLYKLCYFTLPFGESSLAIQNCSYVFPNEPDCPKELRAIIKLLLQPDIDLRPDIYQVCCLAFEAAGKKCPVGNLNATLDALQENTSNCQAIQSETLKSDSKMIFNEKIGMSGISTSVNPRLRPKPSAALRNTTAFNIAEIEISPQSVFFENNN